MVTKEQIILIQTAARKAGLRNGSERGRYDLVLGQYLTRTHLPVRSCKELNNWQIDDFLAICESLGWRYPGKPETYCRDRAAVSKDSKNISYAQKKAIDHLAGDLGMTGGIGFSALCHFIDRMTKHRTDNIDLLTRKEGYIIIQALKAILERNDERTYDNCKDIQSNYTEVIPYGQEVQNQPAPF
jgi:hypothetical protein